MAVNKKKLGVFVGLGLAVGALAAWTFTPRGKTVTREVQEKVRSKAQRLNKLRRPVERRRKNYA
jgi:gas vesicle protein